MSTAINATMGARDWATLFLLSLLWGGSFFFIEIALTAFPPLTVVALRVGLAAVFLWLFIGLSGRSFPRVEGLWVSLAIMAILSNIVPFSLITFGQTEIGAGLASILNATTPLFTVMVAQAFLRDEQATAFTWIGVSVGFAGVAVMMGSPFSLGGDVLGQLAVLGAALAYGVSGVYGRRFGAQGIDPVIVATGQVSVSSLVLVPAALALDGAHSLTTTDAAAWLSVIALAVASTALAYLLYYRLLGSAGATNSALVTLLVPLTSIFLGVLVLGEQLLLRHMAGMMLIGLGLSVLDGRIWKRWVPRTR